MLIIFLILLSSALYSQGGNTIAVLPETNNDLIYIEAEEALVTNFSTIPTLNYSASGQRTLQLNTYNSSSSGYFAEFVVYIEEEGEYSFWYGGTPPGTKDDLYPSFSSPFTLKIDDTEELVFREDVNVVETYAPGLYWIKSKSYNLTEGYHNISIFIKDKRGFDGKYYFYLDSFFLFKGDESNPGLTPYLFPINMEDRSIDQPFNTISFYQNRIKEEPEKVGNYMSLAHIYILIGDFFNSIKMLNRVLQIEPNNRSARLLMAKARIWNGDIDTGLTAYEIFLNQFPENPEIWGEAGKLAAWVSKYDKSLNFYNNGIQLYPDNISLNINKAFTHLWKGDIEEGLDILNSLESSITNDTQLIKSISETYYVNGYPDYAVDFYNEAISKYPENLDLYILLDKIYHLTGNEDGSQKVNIDIRNQFVISKELEKLLELSEKKKNLRSNYIKNLEEKVSVNPTDLELRELLVQTYFWNGMTEESIIEYKKIVATQNLYEFEKLLESSSEIITIYNLVKRIVHRLTAIRSNKSQLKKDFFTDIRKFKSALKGEDQELISSAKVNVNESLGKILDTENSIILIENEYLNLKEKFFTIRASENEQNEFFNKIISGTDWYFNSDFLTTELEELVISNYLEANYLLAILKLFEGKYEENLNYINSLDRDYYKENYIVYLNNIWSNSFENIDIEELFFYYNHLEDEYNFYTGLSNLERAETNFTEEDLTDYNKYIISLDEIIKNIDTIIIDIILIEKEIKEILYNKLVRSIYSYEENTYQTRYVIGDYYLQEEKYNEALNQFKQVTLFDPYNNSANFKLGRLHQLTGNWLEAMETYNNVFSVDPGFQNAASMYNQLSRSHPEVTSGDIKYFVDTGRFQFTENIFTNFNLTSNIMTSINWHSHTINLYKWTDNRSPLDFRVDDLSVSSKLQFLNSKIQINPNLGLSFYNENFSFQSFFIEKDFEDVSRSYIINPILGINGTFQIGVNLQAYANYNYRKLLESNPLEIKDVNKMSQEYQILGYYPLSFENLNSFSFRSYFKIDNNSDKDLNNFIYTGVQDLILGFILLRNPWTILNLYSATSFETSKTTGIDFYYTPENVFVSKIGTTIATWIAVNNGVLGINFRIGSGIYVEKFTQDNKSSYAGDFDLEFNHTKNNRVLYFKIFGSGTFSSYEMPEYWSFQAQFGIRLNLYRLLAL